MTYLAVNNMLMHALLGIWSEDYIRQVKADRQRFSFFAM